jgi:tetratricopeptide (TPR) repeat protein
LKAELAQNELAVKKSPDSNDARFEYAMSCAYTGQIMEGWTMLKKLPKGYSQEVVAKYEPLTKNEKDNWKAPFKLAFGYYFAKRKQDAIPLFEESYRRNPDNVWALGFIAFVRGDLGETDEAIRVCKEALKKEPNATAIHFLLGEGYRRKGQYGKFMSEMMLVGRLQTEEALDRRDEK